MLRLVAAAVLRNVEELLDLLPDDGEVGEDLRLFPAGPIVVTEDSDFLILLILGKHGVHKEDGGLELLVVGINGLAILLAQVEFLVLRHFLDDFLISDSSFSTLL